MTDINEADVKTEAAPETNQEAGSITYTVNISSKISSKKITEEPITKKKAKEPASERTIIMRRTNDPGIYGKYSSKKEAMDRKRAEREAVAGTICSKYFMLKEAETLPESFYETLLRKRKPNGTDLGRAEVQNMAEMFWKSIIEEDPVNHLPADKFRKKLIACFENDPSQKAIYDGYLKMHEWITAKYNLGNAAYKDLMLQFSKLKDILTRIQACEIQEALISILTILDKKNGIQHDYSYIEQNFSQWSIRSFFKEADTFPNRNGESEGIKESIFYDVYLLKALRISLAMIAEYYGVPGIIIFAPDLDEAENEFRIIGNTVEIIANRLENPKFNQSNSDKDLKNKKLSVLTDFFMWKNPYIMGTGKYSLDYVKVDEEAVKAAWDMISDFKPFNGATGDLFYRTLFIARM